MTGVITISLGQLAI